MDTNVTIAGNLTRDPELKFTATGTALCQFGVAVNTRVKNAAGGWEDGDPQFYDVVAWQSLAENIAESFRKGQRVLVAGRLRYHSWEADDGSKRSKVEVVADEAGHSLRWATAEATRNEKSNGGGSFKPAEAAPPESSYEDPF